MVLALGALLGLGGLAGAAFGVYVMLRGGRDDDDNSGGLGLISERSIHFLAGLRIFIFGALSLGAAAFALWTQLS